MKNRPDRRGARQARRSLALALYRGFSALQRGLRKNLKFFRGAELARQASRFAYTCTIRGIPPIASRKGDFFQTFPLIAPPCNTRTRARMKKSGTPPSAIRVRAYAHPLPHNARNTRTIARHAQRHASACQRAAPAPALRRTARLYAYTLARARPPMRVRASVPAPPRGIARHALPWQSDCRPADHAVPVIARLLPRQSDCRDAIRHPA